MKHPFRRTVGVLLAVLLTASLGSTASAQNEPTTTTAPETTVPVATTAPPTTEAGLVVSAPDAPGETAAPGANPDLPVDQSAFDARFPGVRGLIEEQRGNGPVDFTLPTGTVVAGDDRIDPGTTDPLAESTVVVMGHDTEGEFEAVVDNQDFLLLDGSIEEQYLASQANEPVPSETVTYDEARPGDDADVLQEQAQPMNMMGLSADADAGTGGAGKSAREGVKGWQEAPPCADTDPDCWASDAPSDDCTDACPEASNQVGSGAGPYCTSTVPGPYGLSNGFGYFVQADMTTSCTVVVSEVHVLRYFGAESWYLGFYRYVENSKRWWLKGITVFPFSGSHAVSANYITGTWRWRTYARLEVWGFDGTYWGRKSGRSAPVAMHRFPQHLCDGITIHSYCGN